jgi:hypothetical protein
MADAMLDKINREIITPALAMLPAKLDTLLARRHMLAITLQEADGVHRFQVLAGGKKGPARGLWQFEEGGGVKGWQSTAKVATLQAQASGEKADRAQAVIQSQAKTIETEHAQQAKADHEPIR